MLRTWIGRFFLWMTGFEIEGPAPTAKSYVLIAAPHTTNWDLPVMLGLSYVFGIRLSFLAKHTLFKGPLDGFFRWLGGIPVDRRSRHNVVHQAVDVFNENPDLVLAISPEGTRKYTPYWKTGFYHIAKEAGVPIAMGYIDYARKRGGIGPLLYPTGDMRADMDRLRAFYAPIKGKHPECYRAPRLKEEEDIPNLPPAAPAEPERDHGVPERSPFPAALQG